MIIQLVLSVVVLLFGVLAGSGVVVSDSLTAGFAIPAFFIALMGLFGAILPAVALVAMEKRTEVWSIVLYAVLAYQIVTGGGIMSLLPLVALILLIDKDTYQYLTGKEAAVFA